MKLDHMIFTRFSLRGIFPQTIGRIDPLDPEFLQLRISLIKMISLPSILSQTDQNFAWIIIIDPELPSEWRKIVEEITSSKDRSHVVEYCGNELASKTDWVKHLVLPETDYLITTLLDDDDSLPVTYVEQLKNRVVKTEQNLGEFPAMTMAASQIIQWDMKFSPAAHYGYKCPWHRKQTKASSCGFSLACKFPEISLSVLNLKHRWAFEYLRFADTAAQETIKEFQGELLQQCKATGLDIFSKPSDDMIVDMSSLVGPILMTNHAKNAVQTRISEEKETYEKVEGPTTFQNFSINWPMVDEHSFLFQTHKEGN